MDSGSDSLDRKRDSEFKFKVSLYLATRITRNDWNEKIDDE